MKKFFVGCNLEFEAELESEIREIWPFLLGLDGKPHSEPLNFVEKVTGGLVIENSFHLGLQLNLFSKLANRILLRLAEFRVRDFPKLFQKLQDLHSHPLLKGRIFQFEVAASQSRLNNEKRITEILEEIFGSETKNSDPKKKIDSKITETLFVRIHDDDCTVSIDTSGAHLHKRSERWMAGPAPLRETLAAFCGRKLIENMTINELKDLTLIDPMAGTGTLLLETALLYQLSPRTDFPFMNWQQTPKLLLSPSLRKGYAKFPVLFKEVCALDKDADILKIAKERLQASRLQFHILTSDLSESLKAVSEAETLKKVPCLVISNPPYGERMHADLRPMELLRKIDEGYSPERIGLLFSQAQMHEVRKEIKDSQEIKSPIRFKILQDFAFKNGGLPVHFLIFSRISEATP